MLCIHIQCMYTLTMKKRHQAHHLWLILGAYGVYFALFSGLEEVSHGKFWKMGLSLLLGLITYLFVEHKLDK